MLDIIKIIGISLLSFHCVYAQEICNNGIDDDNDMMIDLNDSDCQCDLLLPSSLIPNPSFEDRTCCPSNDRQLNCAVDWIQASSATTDYVHTCGTYRGNTGATPPVPFPNGEGIVGYRAGPNKEYVGACLTEKMEVGESYRLSFYVGFQNNRTGSRVTDIAIFGATSCSDLPFGNVNTADCPANYGYDLIREQEVSGSNEWVEIVFDFEAEQGYDVIVLGSNCSFHPTMTGSSYFYLDQLTLAKKSSFGVPFESIDGRICDGDFALHIFYQNADSYQWYKDGIAIIGESDSRLSILPNSENEGVYQALIYTQGGCLLSAEYNLRVPPYYVFTEEEICENSFTLFGADTIRNQGIYQRTIPASDGCDSIIQLDMEILLNSNSTILDTICEGEVFSFLDVMATTGGRYNTTLINNIGCDSLITIDLHQIPKSDGIEIEDTLSIILGESTSISPIVIDRSLHSFSWADRGLIISESVDLIDYVPTFNTKLRLEAVDQNGCIYRDSLTVLVDRSNIRLYIPNVFIPDSSPPNDHFRYFQNNTLEEVEQFSIYDRWGALLFEAKNIVDHNSFQGWNGKVNGKAALSGTYPYLITARYIDGTKIEHVGDITLIR